MDCSDTSELKCQAGWQVVESLAWNSAEQKYEGSCQNINECGVGQDTDADYIAASHSCHENATCIDTEGSYQCSCQSGYLGDGKECDKIPLPSDLPEPEDGEELTEEEKKPRDCPDGLTSSDPTKNNKGIIWDEKNKEWINTCVDLDECSDPSLNSCHSKASCENKQLKIEGDSFSGEKYLCTCKDAYFGDGTDCQLRALPTESSESFSEDKLEYNCREGYSGLISWNKSTQNWDTCSEIDECLDPQKNDCSQHAQCNNLIPMENNAEKYSCACKSGFIGDGFSCSDINECLDENLNTCSLIAHSSCENKVGEYLCKCDAGYEKNQEGACVNIMNVKETLTHATQCRV